MNLVSPRDLLVAQVIDLPCSPYQEVAQLKDESVVELAQLRWAGVLNRPLWPSQEG